MSLRTYIGENKFSKPDEGDFIYQFAHGLRVVFDEEGYDGVLLCVPQLKGYSDRYCQFDAAIIAKNAIIVIDFKSHGGIIYTPTNDYEYHSGHWHTDKPGQDPYIKGGSNYPNPFKQVQSYKNLLRDDVFSDIPGIQGHYINTGIIFYGNDVDVSQTYIPDKTKSNFFIADNRKESNNFWYYKIKSILASTERDKSIKLSDADIQKIREKFIVHELTDEYIDGLTGFSEAELAERDQKILALEKENEAKDIEIKQLEQKVKTLGQAGKLSSEDSRILKQISADLKTLKTKNSEQENSAKYEQELADLKEKLSKIENTKTIHNNNVYFMPSTTPARRWPLILGMVTFCLAVAGAIMGAAIWLNTPTKDQPEATVEISQPEELDGPYNAYAIDGDTIKLTGENNHSVRLIGVEAPEVQNTYTDGKCFGKQAKSYLSDKIRDKEVYLEYDDSQGNVDYYGRLLRYVWADGENLNLSLIKDGYATEYTYNSTYKYHDIFNKAQSLAKNDGLGLWTTCSK